MMSELKIISTFLKKEPLFFIRILLEKQRQLLVSAEELVIIQFLWLELASNNFSPAHIYLSELSGLTLVQVREAIASLIEKKMLQLKTVSNDEKIIEIYDLSLLINICFKGKVDEISVSNPLKNLVVQIEKEFSRQLSPIEIQCLQTWIYDEQIDINTIEQALKETVLAGVKNFKYMSAIINNWQSTGHKKYGVSSKKHLEFRDKNFSPEEKTVTKFDWVSGLGEADD
ncbi:MAG: DnaD domain-containing protein [Culicoidibacterales bacterium]